MNTIYNYNYKNAPKNVKNSEAKEEKSRKTRSYQEGREFICGACKSGYLSYPALYTHIKTKHNGIYPEGTIRGKNNNNKKRGRPKTVNIELFSCGNSPLCNTDRSQSHSSLLNTATSSQENLFQLQMSKKEMKMKKFK